MPTGFETVEATNSTNIKNYRYNPTSLELEVTFRNGGHYSYFGVPPEMFEAMRKAPSIGRFLHANIKGQFEVRKVS